MDYEDRLTCFIDLLGFKSVVEQSLEEDPVRKALYDAVEILNDVELKKLVYGDIPYLDLSKKNTVISCREAYGESLIEELSESFPLSISQFSDSYVLSSPISNVRSCKMILKCIYVIHMIYYHNLGMMMRGGITVGKLIHEQGGALFGPAMNEAYEIESKIAIYPRVVISRSAEEFFSMWDDIPELIPFKLSFDGHRVFDLISIFSWAIDRDKGLRNIDARLEEIRQDILQSHAQAHPKIAYLMYEWEKVKHKEEFFEVM